MRAFLRDEPRATVSHRTEWEDIGAERRLTVAAWNALQASFLPGGERFQRALAHCREVAHDTCDLLARCQGEAAGIALLRCLMADGADGDADRTHSMPWLLRNAGHLVVCHLGCEAAVHGRSAEGARMAIRRHWAGAILRIEQVLRGLDPPRLLAIESVEERGRVAWSLVGDLHEGRHLLMRIRSTMRGYEERSPLPVNFWCQFAQGPQASENALNAILDAWAAPAVLWALGRHLLAGGSTESGALTSALRRHLAPVGTCYRSSPRHGQRWWSASVQGLRGPTPGDFKEYRLVAELATQAMNPARTPLHRCQRRASQDIAIAVRQALSTLAPELELDVPLEGAA